MALLDLAIPGCIGPKTMLGLLEWVLGGILRRRGKNGATFSGSPNTLTVSDPLTVQKQDLTVSSYFRNELCAAKSGKSSLNVFWQVHVLGAPSQSCPAARLQHGAVTNARRWTISTLPVVECRAFLAPHAHLGLLLQACQISILIAV